MNCFNHPERDALGICKHCNKGICQDCLTDLGHGIACRGAHEESVAKINALITHSDKVMSARPQAKYLMPTFYVFSGSLFVVYGAFARQKPDMFLILLGIGFLVCGVAIFLINHKAFSGNDTSV